MEFRNNTFFVDTKRIRLYTKTKRKRIKMSSYIYIASDSQLSDGSVGDQGFNVFNTTFYPSLNSLESFFFEKNYDTDEKKIFNFSKHFSSEKYQVASIDLHLPDQGNRHVSHENKKALQELLNYIKNHFENTRATYVEILFCLNGQENEPLKQKSSINYQDLSTDDLFYENHKFLTIKSMVPFVELYFIKNLKRE